MHGTELYTMIGLVALTMGIIWGLPKLTKKLPAALTAILVTTLNCCFYWFRCKYRRFLYY